MKRLQNESEHTPLLDTDLAEALHELRKARGLSQEQLADESGYHRTYVSQLERGLKSPSLRTLNNLARALEISTSTLIKAVEQIAKRRMSRPTKSGGKGK